MKLSRRQLLALSTGLLVPRRLMAQPAAQDRLLLTIFCAGGWDQTLVFAPLFESSVVEMEPQAAPGLASGISFVDHPDRPSVRSFFERWGEQTCIINGFEVQAISHEGCTRRLMTGTGASGRDDWATLQAGYASSAELMPHMVVSGPSFSDRFTSQVVRVGTVGQLPDLISGAALKQSDQPVTAPSTDAAALIDRYLQERIAAAQAASGVGREQRFTDAYAKVLEDMNAAGAYSSKLSVQDGAALDLVHQLELGLTSLELGLSRCVTVQYDGIWGMGWDTHADNWYQSLHFEELFSYLQRLMSELATRTTLDGTPLSERVTVAVVSEMGRNPILNDWNGKHHWTYTSAMLIGAGVAGGQVVGGYDESLVGQRLDLATGAPSESGTAALSGNLGATLLTLADIDPAEHTDGLEPISAALL